MILILNDNFGIYVYIVPLLCVLFRVLSLVSSVVCSYRWVDAGRMAIAICCDAFAPLLLSVAYYSMLAPLLRSAHTPTITTKAGVH